MNLLSFCDRQEPNRVGSRMVGTMCGTQCNSAVLSILFWRHPSFALKGTEECSARAEPAAVRDRVHRHPCRCQEVLGATDLPAAQICARRFPHDVRENLSEV